MLVNKNTAVQFVSLTEIKMLWKSCRSHLIVKCYQNVFIGLALVNKATKW